VQPRARSTRSTKIRDLPARAIPGARSNSIEMLQSRGTASNVSSSSACTPVRGHRRRGLPCRSDTTHRDYRSRSVPTRVHSCVGEEMVLIGDRLALLPANRRPHRLVEKLRREHVGDHQHVDASIDTAGLP